MDRLPHGSAGPTWPRVPHRPRSHMAPGLHVPWAHMAPASRSERQGPTLRSKAPKPRSKAPKPRSKTPKPRGKAPSLRSQAQGIGPGQGLLGLCGSNRAYLLRSISPLPIPLLSPPLRRSPGPTHPSDTRLQLSALLRGQNRASQTIRVIAEVAIGSLHWGPQRTQ